MAYPIVSVSSMVHRIGMEAPTEVLSYRGKAVSTTIAKIYSQYFIRDNSGIEVICRARNYLRLIAAEVFTELSNIGSYMISMRAAK